MRGAVTGGAKEHNPWTSGGDCRPRTLCMTWTWIWGPRSGTFGGRGGHPPSHVGLRQHRGDRHLEPLEDRHGIPEVHVEGIAVVVDPPDLQDASVFPGRFVGRL